LMAGRQVVTDAQIADAGLPYLTDPARQAGTDASEKG
jgi:hypothetical protein